MKKYIFLIVTVLTLALSANAQKLSKVNEMYIYGVAFAPTDSVVYMTQLQMVPNAQVYKKSRLLFNRSEYSIQLREYTKSIGLNNMTVAVTTSENIKKAEKKYLKQKQKYVKSKILVKSFSMTDFMFHEVEVNEDDELQAQKMDTPVEQPRKPSKKSSKKQKK